MVKLVVCLTAAAAVVAALMSFHGGRSEREAAGPMNPLQMMMDEKHLPSEQPIDRSLVFEQAPEAGK